VSPFPGHLVLEIRLHLEEGGELRVLGTQEIVDEALTHEHHLHLQVQGLGLQAHGAQHAVALPQRFDLEAAGVQNPLEGLPGKGFQEKAAGVQDQVAAVGPVESAGPDEAEIGAQGSHSGAVLDAADEVLVRGVLLVDHRSPLGLGLVHQEVDPVARQDGIVAAA